MDTQGTAEPGMSGEEARSPNGPAAGAWVRAAVADYEGPLTLYAARLVGNVEAARDVVQETFLRLCRQSPAELNGRTREWLFAVCRNRALDVRRKEKRMTPLTETQAERAPQAASPAPPEALEKRETTARMLDLLQELPDSQQEVLRLKFQHGLSYKEIARVTELSVSHVGVLIHTGLKTLRGQMIPNAEFGMRNAK
ncbi:MAG: sigma-70 family RNA polymerase sigma factor [Planctomycetota bacterium]|nr:sigma-70 family RNA polymerase sigma factor [Planctomycetota bacterium]